MGITGAKIPYFPHISRKSQPAESPLSQLKSGGCGCQATLSLLARYVLTLTVTGLIFMGGQKAMTCKATVRLICEYLEGRLTPEVASEIQRHIVVCRNCRTVFDAATHTLEVYFDREALPAVRYARTA